MPTSKELWAAKLAHVLADAVRAGEVQPSDARRIILHDLRRGNTNDKLRIRPRSVGAQAVIDKYAPHRPPQNESAEALHADHYGVITKEQVAEITTVERWVDELARMKPAIVCLTAAENYSLITWERRGVLGPEKYARAGIAFVDPVPWEIDG